MGRGEVSLHNMMACGEFCWDSVVDSCCSSVHVDTLPGDMGISGEFSGGSSVACGLLLAFKL